MALPSSKRTQETPSAFALSSQRFFVKKLEADGYESVRLIDTTDGTFMGKKEAAWLGLAGSTLLTGKK